MHQLIYLSRATMPFTALDLVALLRQAQTANGQAGVTGLLVYHAGRFLQVLEGPETAVQAIYARILHDGRHRAILKVVDRPVTERVFVSWSMAFREVEAGQFAQLTGYLPLEYLEGVTFAFGNGAEELLHRLQQLVLPANSSI